MAKFDAQRPLPQNMANWLLCGSVVGMVASQCCDFLKEGETWEADEVELSNVV